MKERLKKFVKFSGRSPGGSPLTTANPSSISVQSNASRHTPSDLQPSASRSSTSSSSPQPFASTIPLAIEGSPTTIATTATTAVPAIVVEQPAPPNLWDEVFCKVNDETQKWIRGHGLNSLEHAKPEDHIRELTDLVRNIKLADEKDVPLKIEIGNQKIIVREYVADVVAFLTMAGDVAMTFAPPQASAPWAAAKAVMKIPVKQIEQMAALAGTIQLFTRIVRRGQVYECLYNEATADKEVVSNLYDALRELYTAAIELLARSDVLFGRGMVKQTLNAVLRPEQASGFISDLMKKEQKVSLEAQICEASRNTRAGMKRDEKIEGLLTRLNELSLPLTRVDERVAKLMEAVDKDRFERLMDFISSEKFGKGHSSIRDTRTENTGDWLIDDEDFRDWQAITSSSTLLCLKGTVGTGKTYLTSRVIDHVKKALETSPHDEGFAFFYCNRSGPAMQDPLIALRSLVRQLSYKACDYDHIQSSVIQRCDLAKKEGRDLSYRDCTELILESLNLYSKTTIILDALDESDITTYNLAETLIDLMEKATRPVKVFISSRPDREYLEAFEARSTITVDSSNQKGDIEKFLDKELYSTTFFKKRQAKIQDKIQETFRSQKGGMFRWVYLQVKSLQKCVSDDAVQKWAKTIPRDLMEAYDRLWDSIKEAHDEHDMALAERAIKWVLCSIRPLKSGILLEAIRYTLEGDILIQKEKRSEQEILSLCQDLLTIDAERQVWMLPHASVAEYFELRDMVLETCDLFASKTLLSFLMTFESTVFTYERPYDGFESFEQYVAYAWFEHVRRYDEWLGSTEAADPDPELVNTLEHFLGTPEESSSHYRAWVGRLEFSSMKIELMPNNTPLFTICRYGFYNVLRHWWNKDKISEQKALMQSQNGYNCLALAARGGCLPICRYFVGVISPNKLAEDHSRAMEAAISGDYRDIISLLVEEANVDVNVCYRRSVYTAVQYAARDHPDILQWLVDQGWVDVNREGGILYGNALIAAASYGATKSVEILLKAGADVNAAVECGDDESALAVAAEHAYSEIMQLLLDSGADPNLPLRSRRYGSALEALVVGFRVDILEKTNEKTYEKTLELLLKAGADPAMVLDWGLHGSALAAAAFYGRTDALEKMVDAAGRDRAIECLRQSKCPDRRIMFSETEVDKWKQEIVEVVAYLSDKVGVDEETLYKIGLRDVEPEAEGLGHFISRYH
ncbi:pfs, nacht and ankyrin domain [Trichoderma arundinaceum]|uniref:Pfs, nacht and ankyrin domain n=1 Tax=Trichoderma arundinaceum TaxID=490622 RepID=A0A395NLR1_TRIAR|nr:pfs, nacht and ankyrin domain [Trichoderma arundinaceum]